MREIQTRLKEVEDTLAEVSRMSDVPVAPEKVVLLQKQLALLQAELANAREVCAADADCSVHLRDALVSMRDLADAAQPWLEGSALSRLRPLEQQLSELGGGGTSFEDAQAFALSKEYELARRREKESSAEVVRLQRQVQEAAGQAEGHERQFQHSLTALTAELKRATQQKEQAEQVVASLQKRLDKCQGDAKQVASVYTDTIERQKRELESFKARYNDMVGRELRVGKSVETLAANERELQKALEELKQSYEKKLSGLRQEYAQQSAAAGGGPLLSEREEALQQQVEALKSDLQNALDTLKLATQMGKEAVYQATVSDKPYAQLARELVDTTAQLQRKNEELAKLQAVHDRKASEFAQAELRVAQRVDHATSKDRGEIQRLSHELATTERKVAALQQEIVQLQTVSFDLKRKHQNEVTLLNTRLRETQNHLLQIRAQRDAERNALERQKQILATERESMQADMDFKYNQMRDALNQNYADKVRQLKDSAESTQLQLNQERRNLVLAQRQAQDVAAQVDRQRQELDRYRRAYDEKMAAFFQQKQTLETTLAQARTQSNQFAQMETDYKKRVSLLQQTVTVQRQRFEAQISQLTDQLRQAVTQRNQMANSLEKCSAARDSIVQKVNLLVDENSRLKDMFLQIKGRMDLMRTQYEAHLEKLRAQANTMQNDLRNCAQRLQDASLVHDHVQRMKQEAQQLRTNLEAQIRAAKGNEQALRRLLHDRELEKQQVTRLQAALRECSTQRAQTEAGLASTNTELRDMKRMQGELSGEIKTISQEYQRTLQQQQARMAQEQLQQTVREETVRRELSEARALSAEKADQVRRLQQQQRMLSESLANTEYERARQVQALVDAQNVIKPTVPTGTGRSSLVQV